MSAAIISAENLGKSYRLGASRSNEGYTALRDVLAEKAKSLVRRTGRSPSSDSRRGLSPEPFWALKNVSFEIKRGEVVGIVGRNGAGKSTLLKVLSRITSPTEGCLRVKGRVASLLEVGTGFHPELTGRENIFLNGAILGMSRVEIKAKFDEIVAFADVEKFLDTPVKRYSSGMYVRLAFAVAAHLEPEILVIDEVLAVGDADFQKKCLGKMSEVSRAGRTLLFVSHNMAAVRQLCTRGILLEAGQVKQVGGSDEIVDAYTAASAGQSAEYIWRDPSRAPGNEKARLRAVRIVDERGAVCFSPNIDEPFYVEVDYAVLEGQPKLNLSISLYTAGEVHVLASASITDEAWYQQAHQPGNYRSRCQIPATLLNQGPYYVSTMLVEGGVHVVAQAEKIVCAEVADSPKHRGGYFGHWGGAVRPSLRWKTDRMDR